MNNAPIFVIIKTAEGRFICKDTNMKTAGVKSAGTQQW